MKKSQNIITGIILPLLAACGGQTGDATEPSTESLQEGPSAIHDIPYCEPTYQDDNCPPTCDPYYDPDCGYNPPPPPPPPYQPSYLTYTPFSEAAAIKVSWSPVYNVDYYELQRGMNGAWTTVYTGSQASANILLPSDGLYSFRVQACNNGGCSSFAQDGQMRVRSGPARSDAPITSAVNMVASTSAGGFNLLGFEDPPTLGIGYDRLRQEPTKNNCLDTSSAVVSDTTARVKNYQMSLVQTRDELSTSLNLSQDLSVSAKYGKFSASYSNKKELAASATRVEDTTMVVVSLRDQFHVKSLTNPNSLLIAATKMDMLLQGQRDKYRNHCGDAQIYAIAYGRQAYFTLQLKSFNFSSEEIRTQTSEMKLAVGDWVNAGYSSTKKSEIVQKYSKYQAEARIVSYGSAIPQSGVFDLATAMQYMQSFENEPIGNGEYPIDYNVIDYDVPGGVPAGVYPDYHAYKSTLQRWYNFDQQLATRCEYFDENIYGSRSLDMDAAARTNVGGLSLRQACFNMKRVVLENIQNCEDTTKWSQCIQPDALSCAVPGTAETCSVYANRFPVWQSTTASLILSGDLGAGLSSKSEDISSDACLSSSSILDPRVVSLDCSGQSGCPWQRDGVTVATSELVNASNPVQSFNTYNKCLHAGVTIRRGSWWSSGARVNQTQTVHGLVPSLISYLF